MTEHLGYEKHDPPGAGTGNIRNGTRAKAVLTDTTGAVEIEVPRDRAATFEPQIVKKRQRRLSGVDEVVLSLYAKALPRARFRRTSPRSTVRRSRRRRSAGSPTR
jgi:putative transposase